MGSSPPPADLEERLLAAWKLREELHDDPKQTAYRLFHGFGEGCPGLSIDRLGEGLVVTHLPEHEPWLDRLVEVLDPCLAPALVVSKLRRGRGEPHLLRGQAPPGGVEVLDNGLRFQVEPLARRNPGLYLDARPARRWLLENSQGRRVLNLFAYTGSLGVAAAAGGARGVTHVELQKRQLKRIKQNHTLNGLRIDDRDLIREDLYRYLRRAARKGPQLDGIILDPPPLVPGQGQHQPTGQDYETLVGLSAPLLRPGAWLLCFFNRLGESWSDNEAAVLRASPAPLEVQWRGTSGVDFPEADVESKLRFTAFTR